MKRVYTAGDLIDAQLLADSLAQERIGTHLFNASSVGAMGDIPFANTWPEVWIVDDRDSERAQALVQAHASRRVSGGNVRCNGCGEESPSNFDSCWSCGELLVGAMARGPGAGGLSR